MDERDEYAGPADLPDRVAVILGESQTWAEPPPELENAVRTALRRERSESTGPAGPNAATHPGDELSAARHRRAAGAPRAGSGRWSRGRLLLVAAAAVAVLGVGIGAVISQTGPDGTLVALTATELAPAASGTATITDTPSGFSIELNIDGLAPAPAGTYYQAWLKNADGDLVTIGTFHARDGSQDIVLWSGVDPAGYPTLTITLQQEGAGAASSGQVVLTGSVG